MSDAVGDDAARCGGRECTAAFAMRVDEAIKVADGVLLLGEVPVGGELPGRLWPARLTSDLGAAAEGCVVHADWPRPAPRDSDRLRRAGRVLVGVIVDFPKVDEAVLDGGALALTVLEP